MRSSFLPSSLLSLTAFAALAAPSARGETPANISVEGRGLPVVPGVLRDGD